MLARTQAKNVENLRVSIIGLVLAKVKILILETVCHYLAHSLALQPNSPIRYCLCVLTSSMQWIWPYTTTAVLFGEKATFGRADVLKCVGTNETTYSHDD